MTALSDLLVAAKGDRSVDDLIAAAEKRGAQLEPHFRATAYKALKGDHAKSPRESTLRQLCQVFGLDIRRVREAVEQPPGELGPWTPTSEADRLSRDQRRALDTLIKAIVRGGEAGAGGSSNVVQGPFDPDLDNLPHDAEDPPPLPGRSTQKAARKRDKE